MVVTKVLKMNLSTPCTSPTNLAHSSTATRLMPPRSRATAAGPCDLASPGAKS